MLRGLHSTLAGHALERRDVILQLLRFGITGGLVFVFYTGGTLLLSGPIGIPIVAAIAIAYPLAIVLNFTLQRHFVFLDRETFALPWKAQLARYVVAGVCVYGLTTLAVTTLPSVLGTSSRVVFMIVVVPISVLSFTLLRGAIFHETREEESLSEGTLLPWPRPRLTIEENPSQGEQVS